MEQEDFITNIQCDFEVNVQDTDLGLASKRLASVLRHLADKVENQEFKDGHHDLRYENGRKYGEVYFDFSEGNMFPHPDERPN